MSRSVLGAILLLCISTRDGLVVEVLILPTLFRNTWILFLQTRHVLLFRIIIFRYRNIKFFALCAQRRIRFIRSKKNSLRLNKLFVYDFWIDHVFYQNRVWRCYLLRCFTNLWYFLFYMIGSFDLCPPEHSNNFYMFESCCNYIYIF